MTSQGSASLLASKTVLSPLSLPNQGWVCSRQGLGFSRDTEPGLGFTHFKAGAVPATLRGADPKKQQGEQGRSSSLHSSCIISCCGDATEQGQAQVLHLRAAGVMREPLAGLTGAFTFPELQKIQMERALRAFFPFPFPIRSLFPSSHREGILPDITASSCTDEEIQGAAVASAWQGGQSQTTGREMSPHTSPHPSHPLRNTRHLQGH